VRQSRRILPENDMTLIQLTNTQSIILSAACARDDGLIFPVTANIKGGPVGNSLKSMLKRRLIEEITASDLNTVWRHDEHLGPVTLKATQLAYTALGIDSGEASVPDQSPSVSSRPSPPRKSTKQAQLIEMLKCPEGATIAEIAKATGWKLHSVRGAISGVLKKKLGLEVTSEKIGDRGRVYKIPS
jgi:hypothetical protein